MKADTIRILVTLAVEYGVRQHEKGNNLQAAIKNYWDEQGPIPDFPETLPWRPIAELLGPDGRYDHRHDSDAGLLLLAPELVDAGCNAHGVGMGYFQDDGKLWNMSQEETDRALERDEDHGSWMACKWSMTNDEWSHVCCTPTHYLRLTGAGS